MASSKIEWTELTWNPVTGCTKISSGCRNCYAEIMSRRLHAMGQEKYRNGFSLTLHPETLNEPYTWKKSKVVFVNSMSDLFHQNVPINYIQRVFEVMNDNPQHLFQVLTKRAERIRHLEVQGHLNWSHNIWMGVSVEDMNHVNRIDLLRQTRARVKFLSCEPLIGPLPDMNLEGIDWVIVGGESGPHARPMESDWVIDIMEQCERAGVKFFFKQWGGTNKKKTGRSLQGKIYDEMPEFNVI
jgi:protein gp37